LQLLMQVNNTMDAGQVERGKRCLIALLQMQAAHTPVHALGLCQSITNKGYAPTGCVCTAGCCQLPARGGLSYSTAPTQACPAHRFQEGSILLLEQLNLPFLSLQLCLRVHCSWVTTAEQRVYSTK
jgi:hypothetical protein